MTTHVIVNEPLQCGDCGGYYDPTTTPYKGVCPRCYEENKAKYDALLSKCPQCGGKADRGVDSCIPPSAYLCSKCCAQEEAEKAAIPPAGFILVHEGLRQDGDMRWSHFDQRWTLVYSENMSKRIEDFDFPCARRSDDSTNKPIGQKGNDV